MVGPAEIKHCKTSKKHPHIIDDGDLSLKACHIYETACI